MRWTVHGLLLALAGLLLLGAAEGEQSGTTPDEVTGAAGGQDAAESASGAERPPVPPPQLPALEELRKLKEEQLPPYIPLDMDFRIGIVGEHSVTIETTVGPQDRVKTPLILVNPASGEPGVYAKNFPARIAAVAPNGSWVVGVVPSGAVEGSSGSDEKECAVSLNLVGDRIDLITEFPLHSNFQAYFAPGSNDAVYYCVNEPGAVNEITYYNLSSKEKKPLPAEGNRFYLYGLKTHDPSGIWVRDPQALTGYPTLALLGLDTGQVVTTVEFPGTRDVLARPGGDYLLASVLSGAEASVGYYQLADQTYHQVPQLVLTRPSFKWAHRKMAIVAKESTVTKDRFLWVDLPGGQARELFSGYFKVDYWDISPDDEALVFITASKDVPVLFVIPLDPAINVVNRIRLRDVTNVSWLGCMKPPPSGSHGSWLQRLLPF
jgi:hypothetical protein